MDSKRSQILIVTVIGAGSAILILIISLIFSGFFTTWEDKTLDYRFKLRGKIDTHPDIVLIDIDDSSMKAIGRWPWDRSYHGRMIDILSEGGAAVIGYDILFDHPASREGDRALISATSHAKHLLYPVGFALTDKPVMSQEAANGYENHRDMNVPPIADRRGFQTPSKEVVESIGAPDSRPSADMLRDFTLLQDMPGDTQILSADRTVPPFAGLLDASTDMGHISSNRDPDGTIRRVPLVVNLNGRFFPAFGLSAVASYLKVAGENIIINPGSDITLRNALIPGQTSGRDIHIPVDDRGMMIINYAGRWEEAFSHYSFADILKEADRKAGPEDIKEVISGKIALISDTATGYDLKPVPVEDNYPGGGIHANIINTILTENFLLRLGIPWRVLILLLSGVAASLIAVNRRWGISISVLMLAVGTYWILSYILFSWAGIITDMFSPTVVMFLSFTTSTLYAKGVEQKRSVQLFTELEQLGKNIRLMTEDLVAKEDELLKLRKELSEKILYAGIRMGQEEETSQKIASLEARLDTAVREKGALLRSKQDLEMKLARLLAGPTGDDLQFQDEPDELRQECARLGIITRSPGLLRIFEDIKKAANTVSPVLILGESGTGKELFARAIHQLSPRVKKPFVIVDTPAVSDNLFESELFGHVKGAFTGAITDKKGYFEVAQGGTLFLDEIGDLSARIQAGLLGVLQRHEFRKVGSTAQVRADVRIIAATNKNLEADMAKGVFREDLYYRLNVMPVILPPLRERPEDIEPLAQYFIRKYCAENGLRCERDGDEKGNIRGLTPAAVERLKAHTWNGNIRELENVIARSVVMSKGGWITEEDLGMGPLANGTLTRLRLTKDNENRRDMNVPPIADRRGFLTPSEGFSDEDGETQPPDSLRDEDFLSVLRKNGFNIGDTARVFNISRGTATHRFKGICFETLVRCNGDIQKASSELSGELSGTGFANYKDVVKERVEEYYANLTEVIKQCDSMEDAMSECRRRFKNLKGRYFSAMEVLVRRYFEGKNQV